MITALVLDDQTAYVRALARSLRSAVEVVGTGAQASAKLALRPEMTVALVDICLSDTDSTNREGLDFIRWLRTTRPDMGIIAMSARDEPDLPGLTREAGADVFLPKPLRISDLKSQLARLSEGRT